MIILSIYLTGLIVCILYDFSLKLTGYNPYAKMNILQIILDLLCWPITIILAFFLAIILYKIKSKDKQS